MMQMDSVGALILVIANAMQDDAIRAQLHGELANLFAHQSNRVRDSLLQGKDLTITEDDLAVFLKMMVIGYDHLQLAKYRTDRDWEIQFNPLRSLRPPRVSQQVITTNWAPFNHEGFHFNRPFLRKETFWHGELYGRVVDLLYNKFPFIPNHLLLVPERQHSAPQFLTEGDHLYIWRVCQQLGELLPGIGVGYNSYGAYASVNHLHFQLYIRDTILPIERDIWSHNGGANPYPVPIECCDDLEQAWQLLEQLNDQRTSYNVLYRPSKIYIIPRNYQGQVASPICSGGVGWYEMCGGIVSFNQDYFDNIQGETLQTELAKFGIAQ